MKKTELKKVLKPLIKEAVREVILEEGMLSNIVTEVARGLSSQRLVAEGMTITRAAEPPQEDLEEKAQRIEAQRQEKIRRLNESSKFGDVFQGTKEIVAESGHGALSGVASNDKGVDISGIEALASGKWKALMG